MSKAAKKPKNAVENDKLYKVVEPLQVISDHFGVVLGEEEPEPYITPEEEANARGVFAQYDKDRSGKIDKAEMKAMLKDLELELDSDAYEKYVEAAWASADLDDSGKIDAEEFLLFYARVYAPAFKYGARLRKAVGRDETRMAREYIQRGCDPTGASGEGFTALHYAAQFGHVDPMKMLAERRDLLNVDAKDNSGWTPLMCAASNGHVPALRCLLEVRGRARARGDLCVARARARPLPFSLPEARGSRRSLLPPARRAGQHAERRRPHRAALGGRARARGCGARARRRERRPEGRRQARLDRAALRGAARPHQGVRRAHLRRGRVEGSGRQARPPADPVRRRHVLDAGHRGGRSPQSGRSEEQDGEEEVMRRWRQADRGGLPI